MYSKRKEHMFCENSLSWRQVQVPVFPLHFCLRRNSAEEKQSFPSPFHFLFFHKKKKRKGKTFSHFFFSSPSFREVEEMALFLTFSPLSSLSFQKKRRRKGVEEGDSFLPLFSLFFLSLPLLFQEKKKRRRTPFSLSLSPFGRRNIPALFPFFFFFIRKRREKKYSFFFFSLSLSGRRNLLLSSLLRKRK